MAVNDQLLNLLRVSEGEHRRRIHHALTELKKRGLDALYLTSPVSVFYLTGFSFIATERPAAFLLRMDGGVTFMGPVIEKDHIHLKTKVIDQMFTYPDYPGESHPIDQFADHLRVMGFSGKKLGIDNPAGASGMWGYRGPKITERAPEIHFQEAKDLVEEMRLVKSDDEIELMRESARWCDYAHKLLQDYTAPGLWDVEVALKASSEASLAMKKVLGPDYEILRWRSSPVGAGFRGQVGEMGAIPHSISTKRPMRTGDVLVTGVGAEVGGYSAELERTMILGKPDQRQTKYFETMLKAQRAALDTFRPGIPCSEVNLAAHQVFKDEGCTDLLRHHTGHGMGLEGHEPPWLDPGEQTILRPGMIFSCEPGLYIPSYAGFRHSDTVVVTQDGREVITKFPRDLESLTIIP